MKKLSILFLALIIAVPTMSYAGSATSKWDLTIGGAVKFDMGYADQNLNSNLNGAWPDTRSGQSNDNANKGNFFMQVAETSLTFLIKGPDAFGAKTSALIVGDFSGQWDTNTTGTFNLMQGFIKLDWPNSSLQFGASPEVFGMLGTWSGNLMMWGQANQFDKGFPNSPQVIYTQRFGKNFQAQFGVLQWQSGIGGGGPGIGATAASTNTTWTRAGYPGVEGAVQWSSDACGRVGPWKLLFRLAGGYARERISDGNGLVLATNGHTYYDGHLVDFTFLIPIIPEKQGNKANAMYFDAIVYTMQNAGTMAPPPIAFVGAAMPGRYTRPGPLGLGNTEYAAPVINGFNAHLAYYFTDRLFTNLFYGTTSVHNSHRFRTTGAAWSVDSSRAFIANLMYDASAALRVGVEYANFATSYSGAPDPILKRHGQVNTMRVGAYYFF